MRVRSIKASSVHDGVVIERQGPVLVLTLSRPGKLNALSPSMVAGLRDGIAHGFDDAVAVLALVGRGKSFCAGGDLDFLGSDEESLGKNYIRSVTDLLRDLRQFPKPVIAGVQGWAVGAGAELACEADVLIMATDAVLRFPDVLLGSSPATVRSLVRLVGRGTARAMVLLGQDLHAERAQALGAAYSVVPAAELRESVLNVAADLSESSSVAVGFAKRALQLAETAEGTTELELNLDAEIACYLSSEMRERVQSFATRSK